MVKTLSKLGIENFLNLIKNIKKKHTLELTSILNVEKLQVFMLSLKTRRQCPLTLLLFNIALIKQLKKEIKYIHIGKI